MPASSVALAVTGAVTTGASLVPATVQLRLAEVAAMPLLTP